MSKQVQKVVQKSEAQYAYLYIAIKEMTQQTSRQVKVRIGNKQVERRFDKLQRLWLGKEVFTEFAIIQGSQLIIESPGPDEITITPTSTHALTTKEIKTPDHNATRDLIHRLGEMKNLVSATEYPIDGMRLDVAWKKLQKSNPNVVFEVQVGGNFYEALTKLKHAYDLWNSIPFLVTTEKYKEKAEQLLEGSFHEIRHVTRIVSLQKIAELHNLLISIKKMEKEIKLPDV